MLKTVAHLKYLLIHDLYLGENMFLTLTTRIFSIIKVLAILERQNIRLEASDHMR